MKLLAEGPWYKKTGSLASEFQFNETACTSYIRPGCMAHYYYPYWGVKGNPLYYGERSFANMRWHGVCNSEKACRFHVLHTPEWGGDWNQRRPPFHSSWYGWGDSNGLCSSRLLYSVSSAVERPRWRDRARPRPGFGAVASTARPVAPGKSYRNNGPSSSPPASQLVA